MPRGRKRAYFQLIAREEALERAMKENGWLNKTLARHIQISSSHFSQVRRGLPTSARTAKAIARAMRDKRYRVRDLFTIQERSSQNQEAGR